MKTKGEQIIVALVVTFVLLILYMSHYRKIDMSLFPHPSLKQKPPIYSNENIYDKNKTVNSRMVTLLMWTGWFSRNPWINTTHTETCYDQYHCLYTSDKHLFNDSDALVFHAMAGGIRDLLKQALTLTRPPRQRWVLMNMESSVNTPNLSFLNGHINWTITHMSDSDISASPNVQPGIFEGGFDTHKNYMENKTGIAAALISNCASDRMNWVKKIQKYIDLKVYGRCGNMHCGRTKQSCYAELRKYKFYLSFENSFCKDYVTEKLYENALQNGIVPVIIAQINTSDVTFVPPGSSINALDFPRVKDLTDHMIITGSSPDLYNEYFKWHSNYTYIAYVIHAL